MGPEARLVASVFGQRPACTPWFLDSSTCRQAHRLLCVVCHPQAYSGDALATKAANKVVDTDALAALLEKLGGKPARQVTPNYTWIAGPVVGGVVGLVLFIGLAWYVTKRNRQVPVSFSTAGTDAAVRIRRAADKYAVGQSQEQAASDGGTPTSAAQVRRHGTYQHMNVEASIAFAQ